MRLRLTVQRNSLPAINVVWSVPDTNSTQAYTITRLLEDINHVLPLEAEHWGLEHYVVEVGGFECLHFMPIIQALKEDDHVSIRPLMTAEIRARTLTGRHQISESGQHLVDGVPFGRPYLRHPRRPAIRIPPRKRQRLDDTDAHIRREAISEVMDDRNESQRLLEHNQSSSAAPQAPGMLKTVHFSEPVVVEEHESDSEEDDGDFEPEDVGDEVDSMETDSDSDVAIDGSETEVESEDGAALVFSEPGSGSESTSSSSIDTDSDDSSDSSSDSDDDSDSESDSDSDAPPDIRSSKDGKKKANANSVGDDVPPNVAPGMGTLKTKRRNNRRTASSQLRYLKDAGFLHEDANFSDLNRFKNNNDRDTLQESPEETSVETPTSTSQAVFSGGPGKRKRPDYDDGNAAVAGDAVSELEQKRQRLLDMLDYHSEPTLSTSTTAHPKDGEQSPATPQPQRAGKEPEQETPKSTPSRRLRPNVNAISRILRRETAQAKTVKTKTPVEATKEPEKARDPDFWKSKINLTAFECWDEDVELGTPPFPFRKNWDPASPFIKGNHHEKKRHRPDRAEPFRGSRPKAMVEDPVILSFDNYDTMQEESIILNYDGTSAAEYEVDKMSAASEDQRLREDVPSLPGDIHALPDLTVADIRKGAVVVCKFFGVNPTTIAPEISGYKTATVEKEGDSGNGAGTLQLRIAVRDMPKKKLRYDRKGERIYGIADAFLMEDDDVDESLWEGRFAELLEAKLLRAAKHQT